MLGSLNWGEKANFIFGCLLVFLGFFLSVSVYISDVLVFLLIFFWFFEGGWSKKWNRLKSNRLVGAIILFFLFYLLGLFWGEFHNDAWLWISKQALLLFIPVLLSASIKPFFLKWSLRAFLFGLTLNAFLALCVFFNFLDPEYHHYPNETIATAFLDHFDHSVFLAYGSLIFLFAFLSIKSSFKIRFLLGLILLLFLTSLFLSYGRAGQYSFLFLSFFLFLFHKKTKKNIFYFVILLSILVCVHSPFSFRFSQAISEYHSFFLLKDNWEKDKKGPRSSVGTRLTYLFNYGKIIKKSPFIGVGSGGSLVAYKELNNKLFPGIPARPPHNNYLFIWTEVGLLGLLLWLNIFLQFFILLYKKKKLRNANFIRTLLPVLFLIICFFDEYLVRHNPTLFFCFVGSLLCLKDFNFYSIFLPLKKNSE